MSATSRATFKALSMATSVAGGLLAGALFNEVWRRLSNAEEAPDPKDLDQSGHEVLLAAALQGLIFGVVKALVDRAGAHGYQAVTHENPV